MHFKRDLFETQTCANVVFEELNDFHKLYNERKKCSWSGYIQDSCRNDYWHKNMLYKLVYTTQVNSAFRALWLVNSEVISKYYSPPSSRRERF